MLKARAGVARAFFVLVSFEQASPARRCPLTPSQGHAPKTDRRAKPITLDTKQAMAATT
jgi:hypothetical protein